MTGGRFLAENLEVLIELVQEHPSLHDASSPEHRDAVFPFSVLLFFFLKRLNRIATAHMESRTSQPVIAVTILFINL